MSALLTHPLAVTCAWLLVVTLLAALLCCIRCGKGRRKDKDVERSLRNSLKAQHAAKAGRLNPNIFRLE